MMVIIMMIVIIITMVVIKMMMKELRSNDNIGLLDGATNMNEYVNQSQYTSKSMGPDHKDVPS